MPTISIISPLDQPLGKRRLLEDLKALLADPALSEFGFSVAFAKIGPFYRLQEALTHWRKAGKRTHAIFGIDHNGTSRQALEFAVDHLDEVYYLQYRGHSFHPKIYWFKGASKAVVFVGSNNMTVGGTELNFEATIELVFKLPEESHEFAKIHKAFVDLLPDKCVATSKLTVEEIARLDAGGFLLDESRKASIKPGSGWHGASLPTPAESKRLPVKPASSLPKQILQQKSPKKNELKEKAEIIKVQALKVDITKPLVPVSGFAIQIKPHKNGEIFLSKIAAQQNPAFFGMPFTGKTTPKITGNPTYPERTPDPICNIVVFGKNNSVVVTLSRYALNTVFYEAKSEIRVTASPLVQHVPDYSVMVVCPSSEVDVDYEMQVFRPDSPDYKQWESVCDQSMPSGGSKPRKFGWF
ncbi:MAG: restriction endonuclease [Steroidobacteraceae bacterium]